MIFSKKSNPKIALEIGTNSDGKIDMIPTWPTLDNREEAEKVAKQFAFMVVNSYRKEIMPYIQTTISNHGVKTGSEKMANLILIFINTLLNPEVVDDNAPIVSPQKAFQVRGSE